MKTQPNLMGSVLIALFVHIVTASVLLWKSDAENVKFFEVSQGMEITLNSNTYQQMMQKQQEKKQPVLVKQAKVGPVKTEKEKVKKRKKVKAIQQKKSSEMPKAEAVVYQVEEAPVKEATPTAHEMPEKVQVASAAGVSMPVAAASSQQKSAEGSSGTASSKPLNLNDSATKRYLAKLMRHLKRYKQYPASLKKNHIEGKPVIRFSINKSGQVTNVEVKRRSQSAELDQTAMDVFRRASPLPKIPSELERETLTMSLPIAYSLIND